jgi:hypothetical protein
MNAEVTKHASVVAPGELYLQSGPGRVGAIHFAEALEREAARRGRSALPAQKSLDAAFTRQLEEKLAPVINDLRKQADDTQVALAKVPSNPNCAHTPAANAFDSSVRPNSQQNRFSCTATHPALISPIARPSRRCQTFSWTKRATMPGLPQ